MSQINTRDVVLLGLTTVTTSGTGPDIVTMQGWQAAIITVQTLTVSGTTPTLNVFIQNKLNQPAATDLSGLFPTGTAIYDDLLAFSTLTTQTTNQLARVVTLGPGITTTPNLAAPIDYAQKDAALTAGQLRIGPIGGLWRVKYVVGGTTPSFAFNVVVNLIPFGT